MVFRYKPPKGFLAIFGFLLFTILVLTSFIFTALFLSNMSYSLIESKQTDLLTSLYEQDASGQLKLVSGQFPLNASNYLTDNPNAATGWIDFIFLDSAGENAYAIGVNQRNNPSIFIWDEMSQKWRFYSNQFALEFKSFDNILSDIFTKMTDTLPRILLFMLIEAFVALIIGLFIAIVNPYGRLGANFNGWLFKRIQGRFGWILNKTMLFDIHPDDNWYMERSYIYDFDMSSTVNIIKEIYAKRWRDVFFIPPALIIFLLTTLNIGSLVYEFVDIRFIQELLPFFPGSTFSIFLIVSIVSIIVAILLSFYYPAVWAYSDMGLKKFRINPRTGDVDKINNLGQIIRNGAEVFLGFTIFLALGDISKELHFVFNPTADPNFHEVFRGLDISLTIWNLIFTLVGALAFFLLITAFVVPIIITVSYFYFTRTHMNVMVSTRKKLVDDCDVHLGTMQANVGLLQDDDVIHVHKDDKSEKIEYTSK